MSKIKHEEINLIIDVLIPKKNYHQVFDTLLKVLKDERISSSQKEKILQKFWRLKFTGSQIDNLLDFLETSESHSMINDKIIRLVKDIYLEDYKFDELIWLQNTYFDRFRDFTILKFLERKVLKGMSVHSNSEIEKLIRILINKKNSETLRIFAVDMLEQTILNESQTTQLIKILKDEFSLKDNNFEKDESLGSMRFACEDHFSNWGLLQVYICKTLSKQELTKNQIEELINILEDNSQIIGTIMQSEENIVKILGEQNLNIEQKNRFFKSISFEKMYWLNQRLFVALTLKLGIFSFNDNDIDEFIFIVENEFQSYPDRLRIAESLKNFSLNHRHIDYLIKILSDSEIHNAVRDRVAISLCEKTFENYQIENLLVILRDKPYHLEVRRIINKFLQSNQLSDEQIKLLVSTLNNEKAIDSQYVTSILIEKKIFNDRNLVFLIQQLIKSKNKNIKTSWAEILFEVGKKKQKPINNKS